LSTALTIAAVVLLLIIALLAIPVSLTYQLSWHQAFQSRMTLRWLFGLVRIQLSPSQPRAATAKKKKRPAKAAKRKPGANPANVFAAARQKAFRQRIMRFVQDIWHAIRKRDLNLHIRLGLGDPADTGQLWGFVGPMAGMLANTQTASITIEPDFYAATIELDSSGNIRVIPLQMVILAVGLLLSPPIWRGIKQMRTA
jgi:hypothetical protein